VLLQELLTDIMRCTLLRRTPRQNGDLSAADMENVETRASSAYRELQRAWHFQYVIPNHIGEDSDNFLAWSFTSLITGNASSSLTVPLREESILSLGEFHGCGAGFVVVSHRIDSSGYRLAPRSRASRGLNSSDAALTSLIPGSSHKS
jgi:hypothetical protein